MTPILLYFAIFRSYVEKFRTSCTNPPISFFLKKMPTLHVFQGKEDSSVVGYDHPIFLISFFILNIVRTVKEQYNK